MHVLLDTNVLLWAVSTPDVLSPDVRNTLENRDNRIFFSIASIWEIAIKSSLGRTDFKFDPREVDQAARDIGFDRLPLRMDAVCRVAALPHHHRDPFDRLLVAQAMTEPAVLYTADPQLQPYSELVRCI